MSCMGVDVSGIFSPPRVIKLAESYGLVPGLAFDLTTCDDLGNHWGFSKTAMREKARTIDKKKDSNNRQKHKKIDKNTTNRQKHRTITKTT